MSNQNNLNQVLVKAVHAVANQRLKDAANAIKNVANQKNVTIAERNAMIKNLQEKLTEAGKAAKVATAVKPLSVNADTQTAEVQAMNAVNKLIQSIQTGTLNTSSNNKFKTRPNYTSLGNNNKSKVNQALALRRTQVRNELIQKITSNPNFNAATNARFAYLNNANRQAIRAAAAAPQPAP
jgi:HD-GYP domain-containing protein (c-di-GMP phosphodiesterase class II)